MLLEQRIRVQIPKSRPAGGPSGIPARDTAQEMPPMKALKIAGTVFAVLIVAALGLYAWAAAASSRKLARRYEIHAVDFPIPFPLSAQEVASGRLTPDSANQLARSRALERGRHLIEARYACSQCHGPGFGGGVMIDDPAIGRILGPNLTTGTGGRTAGLRTIRHRAAPGKTTGRHIAPRTDVGRGAVRAEHDGRGDAGAVELSAVAARSRRAEVRRSARG